jgi:predicted methyltransferase
MRNRALGVYEFWKTMLLFDIVKEGMTIIDAGSNKGYYSLLFAKSMNDKGRILSFEPDIGNCFWFNKSIQANKEDYISVLQR